MKWPELMLLIRHDTSAYNILKDEKKKCPVYQKFLHEFESDPTSEVTIALAKEVQKKWALSTGDANTSLIDNESKRAEEVGRALRDEYADKIPHIIFVSPYERTKLTLEGLKRGWPELMKVKTVEDERIREQEHGLANIYSDWRVFHTLHPEQRILFELQGPYWYSYPQGENVPRMRERDYSFMTTVVRDFPGKVVCCVSHHLNILGIMANLGRWSAEQFIKVDNEDKPINCGVTAYVGNPNKGKEGRFELQYYNRKFYKD
jgi:broad specificity phosphatase PhoE